MKRGATWLLGLTWILVACDSLGGGTGAIVISSFTASQTLVEADEPVTLSWDVDGQEPIMLTLQPLGSDVTGLTSFQVTPSATTTYELQATSEAGSASAQVRVQVLGAGEAGLRVRIAGLPSGASALVAASDHDVVASWLSETGAIVSTLSSVTVASAPVSAAGAWYLPEQRVRTVALTVGEINEIEVHYLPGSGELYAVEPNVAGCQPGELSDDSHDRALAELNFIRVLVGLPPVDQMTTGSEAVQEASLMFAANVDTDHYPPADWHCYTAAGAEAAAISNLAVTAQTAPFEPVPERFMDLWADDEGVTGLGHRRWLVDPFLEEVAFGLASGVPAVSTWGYAAGSALQVINPDDADISGLPLDFVAYPRGEFPTSLLSDDWYLSFAVLASTGSRFDNGASQVDYGSSTVVLEDSSGDPVAVADVAWDYQLQGLPNQLVWRAPDLVDGERYFVTISHVVVNGVPKTFEYDFVLR